jgi:hypothetical protein
VKYLKRALLFLFCIILLIQIPYIYRRYTTGKRAARIAEIQSQRMARTDPNFNEYKGVIHVHTSLGGHSTGGFDELIAAANANGLDFVLMTEHCEDDFDTAALTLNGIFGKALFVGGNELDTAETDRYLMLPGNADAAGFHKVPTNLFLQKAHADGRIALVAYPEKFTSWNADFDGIEVFSLNTAARQISPVFAPLDLLWSGSAYPDLTFVQLLRRPDENLRQFDLISKQRRITLFTGIDAHSNIGFHVFGDEAGHRWINFKIDPYETIFRIARMHILMEKNVPLTRDSLLDAVRRGHFFTGIDTLGDSSGFTFAPVGGDTAIVGDEVPSAKGLQLKASSPVPARFLVFKDGERFGESTGLEYVFDAAGPGVYRVEVYQDSLGPPFDRLPWIMANPIYVR